MRKKEITVVIKDENGDLLFTYSEPIELNKRSLENMVWIKKGIWNIKELLNTQSQSGDLFAQAISKAKREAQIEVLTDIFQTCYQEDSKTLELVEDKLSKLNNKVIW